MPGPASMIVKDLGKLGRIGRRRLRGPADGPATRVPDRRGVRAAIVLIISLALPLDLSAHIGPLVLSPYRIVLIFLIVPCFVRFVSEQKRTLTWVDWFVILHVVWASLAIFVNHNFERWEWVGINLIETLTPFLVARVAIRSSADLISVLKIIWLIIRILIPIAMVESFTGLNILREALLGATLPYQEKRLGLDRAFGPFEHPILYGVFVSCTLGLIVYGLGKASSKFHYFVRYLIVCFATFFSLSSGAFSALMAQTYLILWETLTRRVAHRWAVLGTLVVLSYIIVDMLSNRTPFHVFATYLTLNPGTAYARILIWTYGSAEVARHPVFGIGFHDWQRPDWMFSASVDNFWLAITMRYGLPATAFLIAAIVTAVYRLASRKHMNYTDDKCRTGWLITLGGFVLAGATVHYWGPVWCLFMFLLGANAWMWNDPGDMSSQSVCGRGQSGTCSSGVKRRGRE